MNIRSLNKNRSKLYNLLHSLDLTFDVIVLSEIWNCNLDLCNNLFGGYTFFFDVPADTVVGGVGRYVRNCFSCNVLNAYKMESTVKNRVKIFGWKFSVLNTSILLEQFIDTLTRTSATFQDSLIAIYVDWIILVIRASLLAILTLTCVNIQLMVQQRIILTISCQIIFFLILSCQHIM